MPSPKAPPPIYQLRIALVGIDPPIWRQIQVPATTPALLSARRISSRDGRVHKTLRITQGIQAGITDHIGAFPSFWSEL